MLTATGSSCGHTPRADAHPGALSGVCRGFVVAHAPYDASRRPRGHSTADVGDVSRFAHRIRFRLWDGSRHPEVD